MRFGLRSWVVSSVLGSCFAWAAGCDVYDSSLLEPTGGQGGAGGASTSSSTPTTTSTSSGEGGDPTACSAPSDCPGSDGECGTRTCAEGLCGVDPAPAGTLVSMQVQGDCLRQICDGSGNVVGEIDDQDTSDDGNDCTIDGCDGGIPTHSPRTEGSACAGAGGATLCRADGVCVECIDGFDCTSQVCTNENKCASAQCGDSVRNGSETDVDCGGPTCSTCAIGEMCGVASDCASGACDGTCQPSCTDGIANQNESDVDCGGVCADCGFGQSCNVGSDCTTETCGGGGTCSCAPRDGVLLISEIRARGVGGASDDFLELFNAGSTAITVSSAWTIESRSETASSYTVRYTGTGKVVPPGGHLLLVGSAYAGAVAGDDPLASSITDEASVVVKNAGAVVDAVCFSCGANGFSTHVCEGMPATKVGCSSNVDKSIERKPGGTAGNCLDSQDNMADFAELTPSNPQNLASAPTP